MFKSVLLGRDSGFGECIILEFPENEYGIIDSCTNSKTNRPIPLEYLEDRGCNLENVKFIVLTHFHQDHYMGLDQIINSCKNAIFFTSSALVCDPFKMLLSILLGINSNCNPYLEFQKIIDTVTKLNKNIFTLNDSSRSIYDKNNIEVNVHSPNTHTELYFQNKYKNIINELNNNYAFIPPKKDFNLQSIVISINTGSTKILLGADLEFHSIPDIGWEAAFQNIYLNDHLFSMFKIPHHGSINGYNKVEWDKILNDNSILKLTPSKRHNLPNPDQILAIKSHSSQAYSTCDLTMTPYKKLPPTIKKFSEELNIKIKRINPSLYGTISIIEENATYSIILEGTAKRL